MEPLSKFLIYRQLRYVAISGDGIEQVKDTDWRTAVLECLAFKTDTCNFVKRRMNGFLKDRIPLDDLAFACIKIEQEKE